MYYPVNKEEYINRRRSPEYWVEKINTIFNLEERIEIARTVWWEYFAGRVGKKAWHHLDKYTRIPGDYASIIVQVPVKRKIKLLIDIGFTEEKAKIRSIRSKGVELDEFFDEESEVLFDESKEGLHNNKGNEGILEES